MATDDGIWNRNEIVVTTNDDSTIGEFALERLQSIPSNGVWMP